MINFDKFDRRARRMGFASVNDMLFKLDSNPISRQTWWRWCNGTTAIKMDKLQDLMDILELKDYR